MVKRRTLDRTTGRQPCRAWKRPFENEEYEREDRAQQSAPEHATPDVNHRRECEGRISGVVMRPGIGVVHRKPKHDSEITGQDGTSYRADSDTTS